MHDKNKVFLFMRNPHDLHRLTLNKDLFDVITMFYINFCLLPPFSKMKAQFVAKRSYCFKLCFNKVRREETKCVKKKRKADVFFLFFYYYYFNIYSSGVCVMK